jgi:hypothetical protein
MGTSLRHYTYKVTFPGMPWFYFGVHTENGKNYLGSPCTHKWVWEFYDCEVQILEWFASRDEAERIERRLIRPFLDNPCCLNEACGGQPSAEARKRGAVTQQREGLGIFSEDQSWRKEAHQKAVSTMREEGTGLFDRAVKVKGGQTIGNRHRETGHIQSLGKRQGRKNVETGTLLVAAKQGAAAQHAQKWMCLKTGYISTACGLSHYQRARGIDKSQRVKVSKGEEA